MKEKMIKNRVQHWVTPHTRCLRLKFEVFPWNSHLGVLMNLRMMSINEKLEQISGHDDADILMRKFGS
jgi:hypothetical protein